MNTKKYALKNLKTGKISRMVATREAARTYKRDKGFRHAIVNLHTSETVR